MDRQNKGFYFSALSKYTCCKECLNCVDNKEIEKAYNLANETGNQMARGLTMYLLKEYGVFKYDPLFDLEYVPQNYLYEANDETLCIYINQNIKEIKDKAFAYCKIKHLRISKTVEKIGDSALCLNDGEIIYEGTKEEFISRFLGKSKCFVGTHKNQLIRCLDGIIEILKD